jgi:hypothetical protein
MAWYNVKKKFVSWISDIRFYPGGLILLEESQKNLWSGYSNVEDIVWPEKPE